MITTATPTQGIQLPQLQLFTQELSATQHAENSLQIIASQTKRGAAADLKTIREASEVFHQHIKEVKGARRHQLYMRWFDLNDIENELIQLAETTRVKP